MVYSVESPGSRFVATHGVHAVLCGQVHVVGFSRVGHGCIARWYGKIYMARYVLIFNLA